MGRGKRKRMRRGDPSGAQIPTWCDGHWAPVRDSIQAGGPDAIAGMVASLIVMQRFLGKLGDEFLPPNAAELPREDLPDLLAIATAEGPGCCYLGDGEMAVIYEAARMSTLADLSPGPLNEPGLLDMYLHTVRTRMESHDA